MFSSCGVGAVRGLDVPVTYIALPQAAFIVKGTQR